MARFEETFFDIEHALNGFNAPPGETIVERIRGVIGPAAAALHAAGIAVGDGMLAEAIGVLAAREAAVAGARDQWQKRALAAEGANEAERKRSVSATIVNSKLQDELDNLHAETQRLQAQLDYATGLHLSAMRARS